MTCLLWLSIITVALSKEGDAAINIKRWIRLGISTCRPKLSIITVALSKEGDGAINIKRWTRFSVRTHADLSYQS